MLAPERYNWFSSDLIDILPAAVYVCDANGVVVAYNRRAGELDARPSPATPIKNIVDHTSYFVRTAPTCLTRKLRWSGCCEQAAWFATKKRSLSGRMVRA
jgi:hypothetical protein